MHLASRANNYFTLEEVRGEISFGEIMLLRKSTFNSFVKNGINYSGDILHVTQSHNSKNNAQLRLLQKLPIC